MSVFVLKMYAPSGSVLNKAQPTSYSSGDYFSRVRLLQIKALIRQTDCNVKELVFCYLCAHSHALQVDRNANWLRFLDNGKASGVILKHHSDARELFQLL